MSYASANKVLPLAHCPKEFSHVSPLIEFAVEPPGCPIGGFSPDTTQQAGTLKRVVRYPKPCWHKLADGFSLASRHLQNETR
jgi:hypothetical protein